MTETGKRAQSTTVIEAPPDPRDVIHSVAWALFKKAGGLRSAFENRPPDDLAKVWENCWLTAVYILRDMAGELLTGVDITPLRHPRGVHSRKPQEARSRAELVSHAPRLELFARETVEGWDRWGLESGECSSAALAVLGAPSDPAQQS